MKYIQKLTLENERKIYDEWWCPWYECPKCGESNITTSFKYCPDCGERIVFRGKK